jgi:hypothetical protein
MPRRSSDFREYPRNINRWGQPLPPPLGKYDFHKKELPVVSRKVEKTAELLAGAFLIILISSATAALFMLIVDVFRHRGLITGSLSFWAALKIVIFAKLAWGLERAFTRKTQKD